MIEKKVELSTEVQKLIIEADKTPQEGPALYSRDILYKQLEKALKLKPERESELINKAADLLTNIAQILDVVKIEWGEAWSDWDQEQRDNLGKWLVEYHSGKAVKVSV